VFLLNQRLKHDAGQGGTKTYAGVLVPQSIPAQSGIFRLIENSLFSFRYEWACGTVRAFWGFDA